MIRKLCSVSVLGWSFITIGILGNPWVIARWFTQDGSLDFHVRTALLILDAVFLFWGAVILFKRRSWQARHIGYLLVATAIPLVIVESGLQVLCIIKNRVVVDVRMSHSAYKNEPWGREYWKEYHDTSFHYEPFIQWNADEYHGKWINMDRAGMRKTWTPPGPTPPAPKQIFVMGGSAAWGIGARDDFTIPSDLSKLLNATNKQYLVANYGIPGFTLLQEIVKLTLLLKEGRRPDYIVFYDGSNEVYTAYQAGRVVNLHNFEEIQEKVEASPITLGLKYMLAKCRVVQATEKTLAFFHLQYNYQEGAARFTEKQLEALGKDIVKNYKESASLVQKLSEIYNFNYTLFWQPIIFTELNIVEDEIRFDAHCQDKNLARLFKIVAANLVNSPPPRWVDLSETLHQAPKPVYIDFCHMTESGYARVSAKMAAIVREQLATGKTAPRQPGP
jgi:lysophospholipase L1-like esterase